MSAPLDRAARLARHHRVSAALAARSDDELSELLARAPVLHLGLGGTASRVTIAGTPVFAKRVALTELERRPEHVRSTANLFALPTYYQYGVGSAGFGVWRELAAHELTTRWVLDGETASFPLLHHHRVVPGAPKLAMENLDLERAVAYWDGSSAVRARLEAIASAATSVVLVLEYVPHTVDAWLAAQVTAGRTAVAAACAMVERELEAAVDVMAAHGFVHFDAHFHNVLTDGHRLYLGDLGLATSTDFALAPDEAAVVADHDTHDRCYVRLQLARWLVANVAGGERDLPPWAAAVLARHAEIVDVIGGFYRELHHERRTATYPADALRRLAGRSPGGMV